MRNGLYRKAFRVGIRVLLALALLYSPLEMQALTKVYADGINDDYVTLYEENFDDPDNFGSTGGVTIPYFGCRKVKETAWRKLRFRPLPRPYRIW